jgi:hypothetical protein
MDFVFSFALTTAFNFSIIIRGWYFYRITKERIPFLKYFKKLFLADMLALFALINFKFIRGKIALNIFTTIMLTLVCMLFFLF